MYALIPAKAVGKANAPSGATRGACANIKLIKQTSDITMNKASIITPSLHNILFKGHEAGLLEAICLFLGFFHYTWATSRSNEIIFLPREDNIPPKKETTFPLPNSRSSSSRNSNSRSWINLQPH